MGAEDVKVMENDLMRIVEAMLEEEKEKLLGMSKIWEEKCLILRKIIGDMMTTGSENQVMRKIEEDMVTRKRDMKKKIVKDMVKAAEDTKSMIITVQYQKQIVMLLMMV